MNRLTDNELLDELRKRLDENKQSVEELQDITEQLKEVNKKLTESEGLKSHFISNITNEIINPFTSILGLSKSILSVGNNDWERAKTMARLIHSEAFNLDFQLKNIFAAAEIEAGEVFVDTIRVDIVRLINSLIDSYLPVGDKKQVEIIFVNQLPVTQDGEYFFLTDPEKIQLILSNLLDNAIKFSSAASKVEIKVWFTDSVLNLSVQDYGIGISEKNQKIIFDRFTRIDTGINSINRGHGLGLSIIKAMVEFIDGYIEIRSHLKQGSCFTVHIPVPEGGATDFSSSGNEVFFNNEAEIF